MAETYKLRIVTPQGIAYEAAVLHTFLPTEHGFVGVLAHHAPYLVSSAGGTLVARNASGVEKTFRVGPGFFEVNRDRAVFLTASCHDEKI